MSEHSGFRADGDPKDRGRLPLRGQRRPSSSSAPASRLMRTLRSCTPGRIRNARTLRLAVGKHKRVMQKRASARRTSRRCAPATNADCTPAQKSKASPRGRASHKSRAVHAGPAGGAPPQGMRAARLPKVKSFAPRRASHKIRAVHAGPVGGAPPRRMQAARLPKVKSFAPRAGLPQKQGSARRAFRRRAPAANAGCTSAQSQKLRPEGGPPTKAGRCTPEL